MTMPTITPELSLATAQYITAQATCETLEPIITGLQRALLQTYQFRCAEEWRLATPELPAFVTDPRQTYLMDDTDFGLYSAKLHQAYLAHGFKINYGYCPLLIAQHNLSRAARQMVDAAEYFTGLSYDTLLCRFDLHEQFLKTLVGLVLSAEKERGTLPAEGESHAP